MKEAELPEQIVVGGVTLTVIGATVTVVVPDAEQRPLFTVTEYVVVDPGLTVMAEEVDPLLQL